MNVIEFDMNEIDIMKQSDNDDRNMKADVNEDLFDKDLKMMR